MHACRLEFRPSMNKFEATCRNLEICAHAKYCSGFLNRQIITQLMRNCLGVPDDVFRRLQVPRLFRRLL